MDYQRVAYLFADVSAIQCKATGFLALWDRIPVLWIMKKVDLASMSWAANLEH